MKKIFTFFLILITITIGVSQMDIQGLQFKDVVPEWKYISYDSNFVKSPIDPYSTPYWGRFPLEIISKNDDCYIIELVFSQSPYGGTEGTLIHKIDINDGKLKWINHNDIYVGNKYREWYDRTFYFDEEGNLNMIGLRSNDTIDWTFPTFYYYGEPIHKIIDDNTGEFIYEKYCTEKKEELPNVSLTQFEFVKNSNNDIFRVCYESESIDSILNERIDFYALDEDLCINEIPDTSIFHSTGYNTEALSLSYPPLISKYRDDTLLLITGKINPEDADYSPLELNLNLIDISDINNIHIAYSKDVRDDINFPNVELAQGILAFPVEKDLILIQLVTNKDTMFTENKRIWLNWYDEELNLVSKIDYLNDHNYLYKNASLIGILNGKLYVAAKFSSSDEIGYDILEISPGHNNIEILKRLAIPVSLNLNMNMLMGKIFNGTKALIHFRVTGGENASEVEQYFCFDLKELGIEYTNNENVTKLNSIIISPNPTSTYFTITCEEEGNKKLEIIDQLGRVVMEENIFDCGENQVDISGLSSGMYFVRLLDEDNDVLGVGKVFKK